MSSGTSLENFAYLGCTALAAEALINMPPATALVLRLAPSVLAVTGSYLSFKNESFAGTVLYALCGFASIRSLFSPRAYWDHGTRFKVTLPPLLLFVATVLYYVGPSRLEALSKFPLPLSIGYSTLAAGTVALAVLRPRSRMYLSALILFALTSSFIVGTTQLDSETTSAMARMLSASTGLLILLVGYIPRGMAASLDESYQQTSQREKGDDSAEEWTRDYEFVMSLERERQMRGFKPGWLFFRCKETGRLEAYQRLLDMGALQRDGGDSKGSSQARKAQAEGARPDPWKVLGVATNATTEEIKAAFREQMKLYHPDKVASLGIEIKNVAEQKSKEITAAYDELMKTRK